MIIYANFEKILMEYMNIFEIYLDKEEGDIGGYSMKGNRSRYLQ